MRPGPRKRTAPDAIGLSSELSALRDCLHLAIARDVGELPARTVALVKKALAHSEGLADALALHVEPLNPVTRLESASATGTAFILAACEAATKARTPLSILMMRPRGNSIGAAQMVRVCELADQQLRSIGDITRLLVVESTIAVCLEADRPGALAALRRITKALAANGLALGGLEYSLAQLDPGMSGEIAVQRVDEGFQKVTIEPERVAARRVLVVDDERSVLNVIVEQLQAADLNLDIESMTSSYEACIRFGEFEPDLVMLDIRMPEMDGRDALSTMKKSSAGRNAKFMVTSAMPEYFDDMRSRGCDECLVKPFDLDELVDKVARLLDLDRRAAGAKV